MGRDTPLSRRERQIMDILYRERQASVSEVLTALPDPPSYSAVRALLRVLENKGHVRHIQEGARYVYAPTQPRDFEARSVLTQVMRTFFDGSVEQVIATLMSDADTRISEEELERLAALIAQARKEGH